MLRDGDRVDVFARFTGRWRSAMSTSSRGAPAQVPAHRSAEPRALRGSGQRLAAGTGCRGRRCCRWRHLPGQVWRIEGTWRSRTVEFGSRTLTEHPRAKHFRHGPSPTAGRKVKWSSPLDDEPAGRARAEARRGTGGGQPADQESGWRRRLLDLHLRPARGSGRAEPTARSNRCPSNPRRGRPPSSRAPAQAISDHDEEWHVYLHRQGQGYGRPALRPDGVRCLARTRIADALRGDAAGLLELDVWLSPA